MKYRVNTSATYFHEVEVEAPNREAAELAAVRMTQEKFDDADECAAHLAIPVREPSRRDAP